MKSIINPLKFFLVTLMLLSGQAWALGPLHLEAFGSAGYGKAKLANETDSPNMTVYHLGGTVGYNFFPMFYLGATAGFQSLSQLSDTNRAYGNRKGTRLDIAPTLGFSFLFIKLKYEYKMFGDYKLSKKTSTNQEVKYTSPRGHRLTLGIPLPLPLVDLGVYYETISFGKVEQGGTESTLTNKMKLEHYGLVASVTF